MTVVTWQGDHGLPTSLSTINDAVCSRLPSRDIELQRLTAWRQALDPAPGGPPSVHVRHQWPPDFAPVSGARLALIQHWEYGAIPTAWVEPLERDVDELWVVSDFVADMFRAAGVDPDRIRVIPAGVDLDTFRPDGPALELPGARGRRFLFVGGPIARKGIDVLLRGWLQAFAGRDDVTLVIKDVGVGGVYRGADRAALEAAAADPDGPRVLHITEDLDRASLAALYRACDVLVHPYRGEGFAMPVLEAMASGLPVITTAGGPTDEFCPPEAGWRIAARRVVVPGRQIGDLPLVDEAWLLEPDHASFVGALRHAADVPETTLTGLGAAGRAAAEGYSWDAVAAMYAEAAVALASRVPRAVARLREDVAPGAARIVLTEPQWTGPDELRALLEAWVAATSPGEPACLVLAAGPGAPAPEVLEAHVLGAGVPLDDCADISLHTTDDVDALRAACDAVLPFDEAAEQVAALAPVAV